MSNIWRQCPSSRLCIDDLVKDRVGETSAEIAGEFFEASGSISLTAQEAIHIQGVDTIALTQVHNLISLEAQDSQAAETPALIQIHQLIANEANHGQGAEIPPLIQDHKLGISEIFHVQVAENPPLIQIHILSSAEINHSQSTELPGLNQIHILAADESWNGQIIDSPGVFQVHILITGDSNHSFSTDLIGLIQTHLLTSAKAKHEHYIDPAILNQTYILAASDGGHSINSDNPALEVYTAPIDIWVDIILHDQKSEKAELNQIHNLYAAEANQQLLSDIFKLVQQHGLILIDSNHHLNSDSPVLKTWKSWIEPEFWASKKPHIKRIVRFSSNPQTEPGVRGIHGRLR